MIDLCMMRDDELEALSRLGIELHGPVDPKLAALLRILLSVNDPEPMVENPILFIPNKVPAPRLSRPALPPPHGLMVTSRNWSGAYCAAGAERFTQVGGVWTVPLVPDLPEPISPPREHRCSIWVGMGGHRRWADSLPQIGTMITYRIGSRKPAFYAWREWFVSQGSSRYQVLDGFPVRGGDTILGIVRAVSPTRVLMVLANVTANRISLSLMDAPTGHRTESASAGWIVERPSPFTNLKLPDPLCNYRAADFTHCLAFAAPSRVRTLEGARLVRMVDQYQGPWRTRYISVPEKWAEENRLHVTYRG